MSKNKNPRANIHSLDPGSIYCSASFNGRFRPHSQASLHQLAHSLSTGQLQPVSVIRMSPHHRADLITCGVPESEIPATGEYFAVFGFRRISAAQYGVTHGILPDTWRIQATVFKGSIADALAANAAENAERKETTLLDKAKAVDHMLRIGKGKQEALEAVGIAKPGKKSPMSAASLVRLLTLPESVHEVLEAGRMGMEVATNLVAIREDTELDRVFGRMLKIADGGQLTPEVWYKATAEKAPKTAGKKDRTAPKPSLKRLVDIIESLEVWSELNKQVAERIKDWMDGKISDAELGQCLFRRIDPDVPARSE